MLAPLQRFPLCDCMPSLQLLQQLAGSCFGGMRRSECSNASSQGVLHSLEGRRKVVGNHGDELGEYHVRGACTPLRAPGTRTVDDQAHLETPPESLQHCAHLGAHFGAQGACSKGSEARDGGGWCDARGAEQPGQWVARAQQHGGAEVVRQERNLQVCVCVCVLFTSY
eukprot:scaffold14566_cov25-Tisochrysis_lutea.AAC.2